MDRTTMLNVFFLLCLIVSTIWVGAQIVYLENKGMAQYEASIRGNASERCGLNWTYLPCENEIRCGKVEGFAQNEVGICGIV